MTINVRTGRTRTQEPGEGEVEVCCSLRVNVDNPAQVGISPFLAGEAHIQGVGAPL